MYGWEPRPSAVFRDEMPDGCSCAFWRARNLIWASLEDPEPGMAAKPPGTLGWWCPEHGIARPVEIGPPVYEKAKFGQRAEKRSRTVWQVKQDYMQQTLLAEGAA